MATREQAARDDKFWQEMKAGKHGYAQDVYKGFDPRPRQEEARKRAEVAEKAQLQEMGGSGDGTQARVREILKEVMDRLPGDLLPRYRQAEIRYTDAANELEFATAQLTSHEQGRSETTDLRDWFQHKHELEAQKDLLAEVVANAKPIYDGLEREVLGAVRPMLWAKQRGITEKQRSINEQHIKDLTAAGADISALHYLDHSLERRQFREFPEAVGLE